MSDINIIDTASGAKVGQNKCPKCGATDISLKESTGELRCNFCRYVFKPDVLDDMKSGVGDLSGQQIGSGAVDIDNSADTTVTLKCTSCGAEVVVDLNETTQARCHWCRNMLSINTKVPNGAVPDVILPFKMKKEEARDRIEQFVGKRQFYANKRFKAEFTTENVMGVYFPYMLVDMKGHATFSGVGERELRKYDRTIGHGDNKRTETVYVVEKYNVNRECDVEIDDLTVESSARRAGASTEHETNNIINAILPFDTENCVKYDSNYLKGYTSEKRDVNKGDLQGIVDNQEHEAIKFALNDSVYMYDRGVEWQQSNVTKDGEKWLAAYLPVWLYSYVENPGPNQLIHYVAVNARTAETIGSVPINKGRIAYMTGLVGFVSWFLALVFFLVTSSEPLGSERPLYALIAAILVAGVFWFTTYNNYRNTKARHHFERETKINLKNIKSNDTLIKKYETENSSFNLANNLKVDILKLGE